MKIIAIDVETTGFMKYDRVVSLGAVRIDGDRILGRALYLVFDPRKDNQPGAERVHGFDDWTLRHQDLFASLAPGVRRWLDWADLLVAHNAEFDSHFIQRELRKAEQPPLEKPFFCTMEHAQRAWPLRSYKLDACAAHCGFPERAKQHGALEDAMLAAGLYLHLSGKPCTLPRLPATLTPNNLKACPPRPDGELPRRTIKRPNPWPPQANT